MIFKLIKTYLLKNSLKSCMWSVQQALCVCVFAHVYTHIYMCAQFFGIGSQDMV